MPFLSAREQYIFDTLITANLFNGLFSVLNESPLTNILNCEYQEDRSIDTTNFLNPLAPEYVDEICDSMNSTYLVAMENFSFTHREFNTQNREFNIQISEIEYAVNLEVCYNILWRIYLNDGEILDEFIDSDTLYWYYGFSSSYSLPTIPDALRELFFMAGEKYARRVSPYWSTISRPYYQIYKRGDDVSLDPDELAILKTGRNNSLAFRALYNLAVLSESQDELKEAINVLNEAKKIRSSAIADFYLKTLEDRLKSREKLLNQLNVN